MLADWAPTTPAASAAMPSRISGSGPPCATRRLTASMATSSGAASSSSTPADTALPAGRDHAIGVEHAVDRAQAGDGGLQRLRVPHLDHEAVTGHRVLDEAARLDDVDPRLRERAAQVLQQPVAIPRVDLDLDLEPGLVLAVPRDRDEALRVLAQGDDVRAIVAVDRDPAAEADVADDLVARDRAAALGQAQRHVGHALDLDAELGRGAVGPAQRRRLALVGQHVLAGRRLLDARLALLEALQDLVDDDLRR